MARNPYLNVQRILASIAEAGDGSIRSTEVGDGDKGSALSVVEMLDRASNSPLCPPALRRECLVALPPICAVRRKLPSRCLSAGDLVVDHQSTICVGGADVRHGTLDGFMVTVRSISSGLTGSPGGSHEDAYREIITWKNLTHPNVLPLLGVDTSTSPLSIISERTEYGSLREYLARFPSATRSKLLLDTSRGLEYMHSLDCIHGDLKGSSVHVNGNHSAILTNFRLASFLPESEAGTGISITECDPWSVQWLAPELLFPEKFGFGSVRLTKETDIYALAMVMYEVFSGSFPFEGLRNEASILRIRSGDHPRRPKCGTDLGLTDELWKMMKACWKRRDRRWKISCIVSTLERCSSAAAATAE